MNICMMDDLYLFSSEIGENRSEDSFVIFKKEILPKLKDKKTGKMFGSGGKRRFWKKNKRV